MLRSKSGRTVSEHPKNGHDMLGTLIRGRTRARSESDGVCVRFLALGTPTLNTDGLSPRPPTYPAPVNHLVQFDGHLQPV